MHLLYPTSRLVLVWALAAATALGAEKLNVILIMADDVGYECFGAYGSETYKTPNLDRLADSGVRFDNFFSNPLCTPSRIKIMTGRSSVRNYVDFGALAPYQYTFAHLFHDAGYATAVTGKWQLQGSNFAAGTDPQDAGFDTYALWHTKITARPRYWGASIEDNGRLVSLGQDEYGPDYFAKFIDQFITKNKEKPFFVYYPMALVHNPFLPTPDSKDKKGKDDQKNFEDMVTYMDKIVGNIAKTVEDNGLRERTVLMFTADNGTNRVLTYPFQGKSFTGGKGKPIDAGTHTPLIVWGAEQIRAGRVVDDLVEISDFLPTLADISGTSLPTEAQTDGFSFWPQLQGKKGNPREWVYCYYLPRPYQQRPDQPYMDSESRYVRDKNYRLFADGRLFDVNSDPLQENPIAKGQGSADAEAARKKLAAALATMPAHGEWIPPRLWSERQP